MEQAVLRLHPARAQEEWLRELQCVELQSLRDIEQWKLIKALESVEEGGNIIQGGSDLSQPLILDHQSIQLDTAQPSAFPYNP